MAERTREHARWLLSIVLATALVACSDGGSEGGAPFTLDASPVRTTKVDLPKSYRFSPAVIEVDAGSTVTWTNHDNFPHSVGLLDGSDTVKQLPIGESATITFSEPGTVYYHCTIHPSQMHGKVIVT